MGAANRCWVISDQGRRRTTYLYNIGFRRIDFSGIVIEDVQEMLGNGKL